jgi:DNA topoisomerase-6 subunit B
VAKIMGNLLVRRSSVQENGQTLVELRVENHTEATRSFKLHELLPEEALSVTPAAKAMPIGDGYDYHWKLMVGPGETALLSYTVRTDAAKFSEPVVEGLDAELVTGARVL